MSTGAWSDYPAILAISLCIAWALIRFAWRIR